jgi:hypothetical protein
MDTETRAPLLAERDAYLDALVEFRSRLHNHWRDSLRSEAADAEHLARQLDKYLGDFTDLSFGEPNRALDEDRAALHRSAEALRAYAEALRSGGSSP